jgi:Transposase DDE domain
MSTKLVILIGLLDKVFAQLPKSKKGGKPLKYSHSVFIVFFMVVLYKRIFHFKTMEKYAEANYVVFGFPNAPSRKTIRRRFLELPKILAYAIPHLAIESLKYSYDIFQFRFAFVDKSVFRSLGGIWHKKHMIAKIVPHRSIDTEASWAKSAYHNWRFGYGLHIICNQFRFPISACVSTASTKDHTLLSTLLTHLHQYIGVVVGDKGYFAITSIKAIYQKWSILVQTPSIFENFDNTPRNWFKTVYNNFVKTTQAGWLYKKRKPAIEPVFSIIKELFDLEGNNQLPYKSLKYNQSFLLMSVIILQLLMIDNFVNKRELASTQTFMCVFR